MTRPALAAGALLFLLAPLARADRPDDGGGLFHYDEADVLAFVDGPTARVRVHYSTSGPNVTLIADDDASGFPDFAEDVASTAEDVLDVYAAAGFLAPVSELDAGLGALGGSEAFDFYLVDFDGTGDGNFAVDGCDAEACAGHMIMENDFRGYGYPSLSAAIRVLTSHELFHAVQAAYQARGLSVWLSEGTAVWAEKLYDDGSADFLAFADAYLEDTGRSLDRPPVGPVPAFAYGTCLFFEFLRQRLGEDFMPALLDQTTALDDLDAIDAALAPRDASLPEEWAAFTAANLATGPRAGDDAFYPFAEDVDGIVATQEGQAIHDDNRFYPLGATYYFLSHAGGPLWFASVDDATGLVFDLFPVPGGGDDTPIASSIVTWSSVGSAQTSLGEPPAGDYWVRGTYPVRADQSVKVEFCLGDEEAVAPCVPVGQDAGPPDAGVDAAVDRDAGSVDADAGAVDEPGDSGGCSCRSGGRAGAGSSPWIGGLALVWGLRRRRR